MKLFLQIIAHLFETINEWVGRAVSWLTLVLVLFVCYNVVMRKFFNTADAWRGELEWHIFALIFLLGAGYAFKHGRHVRVDLFYSKYSERDKAWTNLTGGLLFLIPWCIIVIYYALGFAEDAWSTGEGSPNPDGLPYRFLIKYAIVAGVGFLLLQGIATVARSVLVLLEKSPEEKKLPES